MGIGDCCHNLFSFLDIVVEINLVFTCKRDISLLEVIHAAAQKAGLGVTLLAFSVVIEGVHVCDGNAVHLLHSGLDLNLVGLAVHDETVTVELFALSRHFLGYDWLN